MHTLRVRLTRFDLSVQLCLPFQNPDFPFQDGGLEFQTARTEIGFQEALFLVLFAAQPSLESESARLKSLSSLLETVSLSLSGLYRWMPLGGWQLSFVT